jgi:hypothetical protein
MQRPRFEFSWRAAFIGCYITPERDRLWVCVIPFVPLYIRLRPGSPPAAPPASPPGED